MERGRQDLHDQGGWFVIKGILSKLRAAETRLSLVYDHYPRSEIQDAPADSQLGQWRDGMTYLRNGITLIEAGFKDLEKAGEDHSA